MLLWYHCRDYGAKIVSVSYSHHKGRDLPAELGSTVGFREVGLTVGVADLGADKNGRDVRRRNEYVVIKGVNVIFDLPNERKILIYM